MGSPWRKTEASVIDSPSAGCHIERRCLSLWDHSIVLTPSPQVCNGELQGVSRKGRSGVRDHGRGMWGAALILGMAFIQPMRDARSMWRFKMPAPERSRDVRGHSAPELAQLKILGQDEKRWVLAHGADSDMQNITTRRAEADQFVNARNRKCQRQEPNPKENDHPWPAYRRRGQPKSSSMCSNL